MTLRRVPINRVLHRPLLLFGAERELALFVTVIAVALPVNGLNVPAIAVGVLVWIVGMPLLIWMAKINPRFSKIYTRSVKYRRYYPARSRPYRRY